MVTKKKKIGFYQKYIVPNMGVSIFIMLIGGGITYYITGEKDKIVREAKDKEIESRIYPTPLILQKAMDHDNEVPTDVENFIREQRLIEQGDTLLVYQSEIAENIKVIDSFFQFAKEKKYTDSIKDIAKDKSRDARTEEIQNIGNILRVMQRDTTN